MGCDIHAYTEQLIDGEWVCDQEISGDGDESYLEDLDLGRNYILFGTLVDRVRTSWPWSFEYRGVPDDVSLPIQKEFDSWDCDMHSHSFLRLKELRRKAGELFLIGSEDALYAYQGLTHIINQMNDLKIPESTEQRLVFSFDN